MSLSNPAVSRRSGLGRSAALGRRSRQRRVSLCETLDRVLNKGAVVAGDVVISVAGVDLVYLQLSLLVTSVETMRQWAGSTAPPAHRSSIAPTARIVEA